MNRESFTVMLLLLAKLPLMNALIAGYSVSIFCSRLSFRIFSLILRTSFCFDSSLRACSSLCFYFFRVSIAVVIWTS